jgi:hypothetical protein
MRTRPIALTVLLVTSLAAVSCSRTKPGYQVQGKVLFEGKPAAGALVTLHPLDQEAKLAIRPRGVADEDGNFKIGTNRPDDGAPPGAYAVTFHWSEKPGGGDQEGKSLLPPRYLNPETSGISVQVLKGKNVLEPFELRR